MRYLEAILQAVDRKAEVAKRRLRVFPGFEITASVPGHVHMLCIFEPGTSVDKLSHALTELGLPPDERGPGVKSIRNLGDVLDIVQDERGGIVIAAHADQRRGALDDAKYADAWIAEVVCNPRLLAVELTLPGSRHSSAARSWLRPTLRPPCWQRRSEFACSFQFNRVSAAAERSRWAAAAEEAEQAYLAVQAASDGTDPAQVASTLDLRRAALVAEQDRLTALQTRASQRPGHARREI